MGGASGGEPAALAGAGFAELCGNFLPAALAMLGLGSAARRLRRQSAQAADQTETTDDLLLFATAVAGVVASPSGWVMGLVVALPLAPRAADYRPKVGFRAPRR